MIQIKEIRNYIKKGDRINRLWKVFDIRRTFVHCRHVNERKYFYDGAKIKTISRGGETYYCKKRRAERGLD